MKYGSEFIFISFIWFWLTVLASVVIVGIEWSTLGELMYSIHFPDYLLFGTFTLIAAMLCTMVYLTVTM